VKNRERVARYADVCRATPGVGQVLDRAGQARLGLDHERSGDLVLVASEGRWFCYNYWLDDSKAPDFARTVDIHRKPGYDPVELFLDPRLGSTKLAIGWKLFKRKLGFRTLLDVIPLDPSLVRGSHGRLEQPANGRPILITQRGTQAATEMACSGVRDVILQHLFDS
jgi:hypothetical protein